MNILEQTIKRLSNIDKNSAIDLTEDDLDFISNNSTSNDNYTNDEEGNLRGSSPPYGEDEHH